VSLSWQFLVDKTAQSAVGRSFETAVGVHSFSVSLSWQFLIDKTAQSAVGR
jgi:hypothetical protein